MSSKLLGFLIGGIALGFVSGFLVANTLNRSEINKLVAENNQTTKQGVSPESTGSELSNQEIAEKISEANENPKDFAFQKGLGLALYRYAAKKEDAELLAKVATLLQRAHSLNKDDYQVIVSLGNVNFDLGQINSDPERNLKARKAYEKAISKNPKDINVVTDFGLTYLLTQNPDIDRAKAELKKALDLNPKYERALQYMTQTQIKLKNFDAASVYLARLKEVSPKNAGLAGLEKTLVQIK